MTPRFRGRSSKSPRRDLRPWSAPHDELTLNELEYRRLAARRTRFGVVAIPLAVIVGLSELAGGRISLWSLVAVLLLLYGGVTSYALGVRWERRWAALIRERRAQR